MTQATCSLAVGLYLIGDSLDPETVTEILGVTSSKQQQKGQRFVTASGKEFSAKKGSWTLVVQEPPESLEVHLGRLLSLLPKSRFLAQLPGVESAFVDVFIAAESTASREASCELAISADLLLRLAQLGLDVKVTFSSGPAHLDQRELDDRQ